jgi:hypothetical protein
MATIFGKANNIFLLQELNMEIRIKQKEKPSNPNSQLELAPYNSLNLCKQLTHNIPEILLEEIYN